MACSTNRENRNKYRVFVEKIEGRTALGTPRSSWMDNIKMDWNDLSQDREQCRFLVNAVMNFLFPYNYEKF
jgi:hypothetical protein